MNIRVSVVIPVYNEAEKLRQCLRAVFDTQYRSFEVIVVDDNSSAPIEEVARGYGCRYLRLSQNKGAAHARNQGVAMARGSLIAFIDADCIPRPDWVAYCNHELSVAQNKNPQTAAICGRVSSEGSFFQRIHDYTGYAYVQRSLATPIAYLNTACAVVDKEAFSKVGGFSENFRVGEDPELALKLVEAGYAIRYCPTLAVIHDHDIDTFAKVMTRHLGWGKSLGLKMERKHGGRTGGWHFLLENHLTHLVLLPALALASTVKIALYNRHERRMWKYFAFILAAKLSFRWGVFLRIGTRNG